MTLYANYYRTDYHFVKNTQYCKIHMLGECPNCGKKVHFIGSGESAEVDVLLYKEKCPHCNAELYVSPDECLEPDDDDEPSLDIYEAAQIWASNGKDEDYTFGYTEDELEDAL